MWTSSSFSMVIAKKTWSLAAKSPGERAQWISVLEAGSRGDIHKSPRARELCMCNFRLSLPISKNVFGYVVSRHRYLESTVTLSTKRDYPAMLAVILLFGASVTLGRKIVICCSRIEDSSKCFYWKSKLKQSRSADQYSFKSTNFYSVL